MLDYIVMQMRKTNREKGYSTVRTRVSLFFPGKNGLNSITRLAIDSEFPQFWKLALDVTYAFIPRRFATSDCRGFIVG